MTFLFTRSDVANDRQDLGIARLGPMYTEDMLDLLNFFGDQDVACARNDEDAMNALLESINPVRNKFLRCDLSPGVA